MLVENKFLYLSLPRTSSMSFRLACLKYGVNVKYHTPNFNKHLFDIDLVNTDDEDIVDSMRGVHMDINLLKSTFGESYPIVAIKRNPYEKFISLWEHYLDELKRLGDVKIYEQLKELTLNDILFFEASDIISNESIDRICNSFLKKHNIVDMNNESKKSLNTVFKPDSFYHLYNENIIWFDFENLKEFADWVSNTINKPFELPKVNSSKHIKTKLILDDNFKKRWDSIYDLHTYNIDKRIKLI